MGGGSSIFKVAEAERDVNGGGGSSIFGRTSEAEREVKRRGGSSICGRIFGSTSEAEREIESGISPLPSRAEREHTRSRDSDFGSNLIRAGSSGLVDDGSSGAVECVIFPKRGR